MQPFFLYHILTAHIMRLHSTPPENSKRRRMVQLQQRDFCGCFRQQAILHSKYFVPFTSFNSITPEKTTLMAKRRCEMFGRRGSAEHHQTDYAREFINSRVSFEHLAERQKINLRAETNYSQLNSFTASLKVRHTNRWRLSSPAALHSLPDLRCHTCWFVCTASCKKQTK